MIILLYLCVILGWALLILVIKCRKAREKRILLQQQQEAQAQAAVHVIQIGNSFYDVIPITNSGSRCSLDHPHTCRRFLQSNSTNSLSHTNPSFIMDESVFPNGNMGIIFYQYYLVKSSLFTTIFSSSNRASSILRGSH